jgi:hypothetical protein
MFLNGSPLFNAYIIRTGVCDLLSQTPLITWYKILSTPQNCCMRTTEQTDRKTRQNGQTHIPNFW